MEVTSGCGEPADCSDGNACTDDVCNQDGSCGHPAISCDDGSACITHSCDVNEGDTTTTGTRSLTMSWRTAISLLSTQSVSRLAHPPPKYDTAGYDSRPL